MRWVFSRRASALLFAVVLAVGLLLRLLALRTSLAQQDSDRAIVYLMARHVAHGEFRIFYWGQFYGGTLVQLTAGVLFWLTGPRFVTLQIVEIGFWLATCLLLRTVVARGAGAVTGDLAGCLFWLAAPFMISISFSDPFLGDGMAIGFAAILLAQRTGGKGRAERARYLGLGLFLGLALWTTPLALAFALPAAVWACMRVRSIRVVAAAVAGAVLGASPWLYETLKSGGKTLHQLPGVSESPIVRYLHVFTEVIPAVGGLAESPGARAIGGAALVILVVGTVFAVRQRNATMFVLAAAAFLLPVIAVESRVAIDASAARYGTYLIPVLAAFIAWALSRIPLAAVATVLLVCSWTIGTVWNSTSGLEAVSNPAIGRPITLLAARLERLGRTDVWADYWIAYMLSAATQERIIAGDLSPRREESYLIRAAQAPKTTVILYPGRENEQTLRKLRGLPPHRRILVGPFAVWLFDTRVDVDRHLLASY